MKITQQTITEDRKPSILERIKTDFSFVEGNFRIMLVSWLVLDFFSELPGTYWQLYAIEISGSVAILGLLSASEQISRAIVQIPGGYLADKYGRKWLIAVMTLVSAFARIFFVFAPSWEWLLVGSILVGLTGIYNPALNAIVADSVPSEKRGMGFTLINLIASVSTTPAPLVAGYLFSKMGLIASVRLCYILSIMGFTMASLLRFRLKETVDNPLKINLGEMITSYPVSFKESINVWRVVPRQAFVLFIIGIITQFMVGLFQPILIVWFVDDLGIPEVAISYIMTTLFVTMIIFSIPAGKLIDKIGKRTPLILSYILWAIAVPLVVWGDYWRVVIAMTLVGVLQVMLGAASSALSADLVPKEHRGKVNGSRGFFSMISMSLGMITSGWLYDNVSHVLPWYIELLLTVIPLTLYILYVKEPETKEE